MKIKRIVIFLGLVLSLYMPTVMAAKTIIMYSDEVRPDDVDSGKKVDEMASIWKESSSQRGISNFEIMSIDKQEEQQIVVKGVKSGISTEITLRNMHNTSGIKGLEGQKNKFNFKVLKNTNLQSNSPRPASLASPYPFFSDYGGDQESQNGVMFEFSEPVQSFGAWFGDLETRSDGLGKIAYARILDNNDKLITEYNIRTSTKDQKLCGYPVNESYQGCGKRSTRWIGFVADTPKIKKFIVVVGDDDSIKGMNDGGSEHISFIGPTIGYKDQQYTVSIFNDRNNNSLWDDNESPLSKTKVLFDGQEVLTNDMGLASFKSSTKKQTIVKVDGKQFASEYKLTTGSKGGTLNQSIDNLNPKGQNIGIYFPPKIAPDTAQPTSSVDAPASTINKSHKSLENNVANNNKEEVVDKVNTKKNTIAKDQDKVAVANQKDIKKDSTWLNNAFNKTVLINHSNKSTIKDDNTIKNDEYKKDAKEKAIKIQEELIQMDNIVLAQDKESSKESIYSKQSEEKMKDIDLDNTLMLSTNANQSNSKSNNTTADQSNGASIKSNESNQTSSSDLTSNDLASNKNSGYIADSSDSKAQPIASNDITSIKASSPQSTNKKPNHNFIYIIILTMMGAILVAIKIAKKNNLTQNG